MRRRETEAGEEPLPDVAHDLEELRLAVTEVRHHQRLPHPRAGVRRPGIEQDPFALSEPQLADFRNRRIGFVFQDHHLLPQCSVLENVLIPTLVNKAKVNDTVKQVHEDARQVAIAARRKALADPMPDPSNIEDGVYAD